MAVRDRLKQRKFTSLSQEALLSLLTVASAIFQDSERVCAGHGITHVQYNVLRILRGVHPGGHPRFEISSRMITRAPDVTRLIDRLVKMGLVERAWSEENRRLSIARITEKGLALLEAMEPEMLKLQQDTAGRLKKSELKEVIRILNRLSD